MFKKKKKINLRIFFIIIGITIAISSIISALCFIVISDNISECEKMSLGGNLFGCTPDSKYVFDNIYLVVGNTANSPMPSLSKTVKKYIVNSSVSKNADIRIYSATSAHSKLSFHNSEITDDNDNIEEMAKMADEKLDAISKAIATSSTASGAEYIDTILKAGKALINNEDNGDKSLIIVIGSGVSDGGILDFTKGKWNNASAEETTRKLVEAKQIASDKISGISLYWSGIGEVVEPQKQLSEDEKNSLSELYETVLEELGVKVIGMEETAEEKNSVDTMYLVTPIPVQGPECVWCEARDLSSDEISFIEDTSIFSDEDVAIKNLESLIKELNINKNEKVNITGYVSRKYHDCSVQGVNHDLALLRAEAVKQLLEKKGISGDRIVAASGGKGVRGGDECENGQYDANRAKQNMFVEIKAEI